MKSPRLAVLVVAAIAFLRMTQANSDEADKATAQQPADPMRGKETGQVRDDNGLKMKVVWCPPGKFSMGSPATEVDQDGKHRDHENQVRVTLTKGFWLGKYEVTQKEWKQITKTEPWKLEKSLLKEGAELPAANVSWEGAMSFCQELTEQEREAGRLPDGWEYTLPTEAQWERACRAGTETRFSFGDDESKLGEHAWFGGDVKTVEDLFPKPVGQKKPNPWGLHDMHGNASEFCWDGFTEKLPGGTDPEVKPDKSNRVTRGGNWMLIPFGCRCAERFKVPIPTQAAIDKNVGFACCDGFRVALCEGRKVR